MPTLLRPFRFQVGLYSLLLPETAAISAEVKKPPAWAVQIAWTHWAVALGRFQLSIHLDPIQDLDDLSSFIRSTTKKEPVPLPIAINGIDGVMHGDYGPPRTWIDWWFKKGDEMICMCLQSTSFPFTEPRAEEVAEHNAIIKSLKFCRDFPGDEPPPTYEPSRYG